MFYWSNDLQCFRDYQQERQGYAGHFDDMEVPYNMSQSGEEFDDTLPIYGSQVHLHRPLTDEEFWKLRDIESMFDSDGDFPDEGEPWNIEGGMHSYWLNFEYFSAAARAYLESLPD